MKTPEELDTLTRELEELNNKLAGLNEEELEEVCGGRDGSTPLSKYLRELEHDKGERLAAHGDGSALSLDPSVKYENEGNLLIVMREKQEMP